MRALEARSAAPTGYRERIVPPRKLNGIASIQSLGTGAHP